MADDQNSSTKSKNTLQNSSVEAGENVHIGDVNVNINLPGKKPGNFRKLALRVSLFIFITFGITWVGYKVVFPQLSTKKEPLDTQTQKPEEIRSLAKPSEYKAGRQINNSVAGNATCEGEGIKGITITAESGEKATTDENGHFQMTLKSEIQIERVRLYFNDPSGKYDIPSDLTFNVPKSNIPIRLEKKINGE